MEPPADGRRRRERLLVRAPVDALRHRAAAGSRGDGGLDGDYPDVDGRRHRGRAPRLYQRELRRRRQRLARRRPGHDRRDRVLRLPAGAGQDLLLASRRNRGRRHDRVSRRGVELHGLGEAGLGPQSRRRRRPGGPERRADLDAGLGRDLAQRVPGLGAGCSAARVGRADGNQLRSGHAGCRHDLLLAGRRV